MSYIKNQLTRECQILAYDAITSQLLSLSKCLVKMFCGSGKSRLITATIIGQNKNLSVVVVPSLALIQQFYDDYLSSLKKPKELSKHKLLNVSSKSEKDLLGTDVITLDDIHISCTTDPSEIKQFLNSNQKSKKIICVTYQSLDVLIANLDGHILGLTCFDEAHRTASHKYKELIYGSANIGKYEKQVFFTATPVNKNNITMYDRENNDMGIYGDCGPLHPDCEYTYLNGLRDDVLSLFNIRIDMFTGTSETRKVSLYESIARTILASGNSRVLTFHKDVAIDSSSDTSVLRFIQNGQSEFKFAFDRICANEFPEKVGYYTKITLVGLTAGTRDKKELLTEFGNCADNEIFILASCGTIGEGVDTKNANMTVFVDPKTSVKDIIQNIGRVCRKIPGTNRPAATVLIPVWVDTQKYRDCGNDIEKRDAVLREQLNLGEKGDYNAVLNVCAALQQEDPELYDLCLRYPSNFTEAEREHALKTQGCNVDYEAEPLDDQDIQELIDNGVRVEIHTSNPEAPVVIHNEDGDDEDAVCLYVSAEDAFGADTESARYYPIVPVEEKEKRPRNLDAPKKTNRPRIDYHTNDEIRLYWKVSDDTDFSNRINSSVLECQVERLDNVEIWKNKHKMMCEFIDTNKKSPSRSAKDPTEKNLGNWISTQKVNYDARGASFSKQIMKTNLEIWNIWNNSLANPEYSDYLKRKAAEKTSEDPVQDWKNRYYDMFAFIYTNNIMPSNVAKDPVEKKLGKWFAYQKTNYNFKGVFFSKRIMVNNEIWQLWTDLNVYRFIVKNKREPTNVAIDNVEKRLGQWLGEQKMNYNIEGADFSTGRMANKQIWQVWKYYIFFIHWLNCQQHIEKDADLDFKKNYFNLCEFMDKFNRTPSNTEENEKTLGKWVITQKKNYDPRGAPFSKATMKKNEYRWISWTKLLNDPKYKEVLEMQVIEYLIQNWKDKHCKVLQFIDTPKREPSKSSQDKEEQTLGYWLIKQKKTYDPKGAGSSKYIMKNEDIWQIWTDTLADPKYSKYLVLDPVQDWKNKHEQMSEFIDTNQKSPTKITKDPTEKTLATWLITQKGNYKPEGAAISRERMKNPEIWQIWTDTLADPRYSEFLKKGGVRGKTTHSSTVTSTATSVVSSMNNSPSNSRSSSPAPSPKPAQKSHILPQNTAQVNSVENILDCGCDLYDCLDCSETPTCRNRQKSEYQKIGTSWDRQKSTTTHEYLKANPQQWKTYHDARDFSFKGYTDQSQIPRNRIITHLEKKAKHKLRILDLGCGRNYIAQHFKEHAKMKVIGYDHVVEKGSGARVGNIVDLRDQEDDENTDICVYSQSLMGSDKMEYLLEGYRLLRYGGEMIISDSVSMLEDVKAKLQEIGMKVEELEHDDSRWFLLCARKC
jgi:superfamily II DNA or RNA helicase